jgi:hypothetical protein
VEVVRRNHVPIDIILLINSSVVCFEYLAQVILAICIPGKDRQLNIVGCFLL